MINELFPILPHIEYVTANGQYYYPNDPVKSDLNFLIPGQPYLVVVTSSCILKTSSDVSIALVKGHNTIIW